MDSYELILPIYPFRSPFWLLWISLYRLPLVQNLLSVQDVRYKKTIIFFTLLACFPGHVCTQNVVEKKGNQRFLKLQFLYFIGMEAWRLYSSHTTLSKHGQFRKRLAFFYVSITFCKPQKTHMIPITYKCLLQPICILPAKPCVQPFVALVPHIPLQKPLLTLMNILV